MINYNSTDNSVDIIKKYTPSWKIINSVNKYFDASQCDSEVMLIEKEIEGIKICLNVTEFLLCKNISSLFSENIDTAFAIQRITMVEKWDCFNKFIYPVWESRYYGYKHDNLINGKFRFIHNYIHGNYTCGRHGTSHSYAITNRAIILWYGFSPFNFRMILRKLQIKHKIPKSDFEKKYGIQHNINLFGLLRTFISQHKHNDISDLRSLFQKYV
jgi:hypothetical protein